MKSLRQDIVYGLRTFRKSPGFTAVAILTLALGIGANTVIFSVVNTVLLRPLPYENPERLVMVWETNKKKGLGQIPASFPNFTDVRAGNKVFDDLGAFTDSTFNLTGGDEPEQVKGLIVTPELFSLLGVRPLLGRTFVPEEGKPGAGRVLLLSHGLWQSRFGSNPNLIDQTVALNGESYSVVGVMPPGFQFPPTFTATIASSRLTFPNADLWLPLTPDNVPASRGVRSIYMLGRLKRGATPEQAQSDLSVIAAALEREYPGNNTGVELSVTPLQQQVTGDIRLPLFTLLAAVAFVLLIACVNVANLLLAKAVGRQKEVAIRTALGASRLRMVQQMLTESVVLSLLGAVPGLLLAWWGVRQLAAISPVNMPRVEEVGLDARALIFTLVVSLLTAVVFGLAPALYASRSDLNETLKEGGRGSTQGKGFRRLRSVFVVFEVALALVLLIAAGLMVKSFLRLQNVNPGFDPNNVLTLELMLPQSKYGEPHQRQNFQRQLVERVSSIPGVRHVGTVNNLPFSGNEANNTYTVEGQPVQSAAEKPRAFARVVSPGYFQTMAIPLRQGRLFTGEDTADSPTVVIVNETAARRFWPGADPVGKRLKQGALESKFPWLTVVGVVGSVSHTTLDVAAQPEIYVPYLQSPDSTVTLVARTSGAPLAVTPAVRREVRALDADLPLTNIKGMDEMVSGTFAQPRLYTFLFGIFAALALVLAVVGIYGILSYSVSQRAHEIGIRMALGAQQGDILKLVVGQAAVLILIGMATGLLVSFALTRVMSSLLYGVSASDPVTFLAISLLLFTVGLLASFIPARRATKVTPLKALRHE